MHYSHSFQLRMLLTALVGERLLRRPGFDPFDPRSHADRDFVQLAKDEDLHVYWHEAVGDSYQVVCICSWRGEASDDIAGRACEGIQHVYDVETTGRVV